MPKVLTSLPVPKLDPFPAKVFQNGKVTIPAHYREQCEIEDGVTVYLQITKLIVERKVLEDNQD